MGGREGGKDVGTGVRCNRFSLNPHSVAVMMLLVDVVVKMLLVDLSVCLTQSL